MPGPPRSGTGNENAYPTSLPASHTASIHPATTGAEPTEIGLAERLGTLPVPEHAAVFEEELRRLQRRLATIDQL